MVVHKVSNSMFSSLKTVQKALQKAVDGDVIQMSAGAFQETNTIAKNVSLIGKSKEETIFRGVLHIATKQCVTIEHISFHLQAQLIVEGEVQFKHCHFNGEQIAAICAIDGGRATFIHCTFEHSKEIGLYVVHDGHVNLIHCTFTNNKRVHVLCEKSTIAVENSTFTQAQHGIWLKDEALCEMKHSAFHMHNGTQLVVQNSTLRDRYSTIYNGKGNGIFADKQSRIELRGTEMHSHTLPQLWIKESFLQATDCSFKNGTESAIMLQHQAEGTLTHCYFQKHHLATVQAIDYSLLNMKSCQVYESEGYGVQLRNKSIANFDNTILARNVLAQLHLQNHSIASLKDCKIKEGKHVAFHIDDRSCCDIVQSHIFNHPNTAIIVLKSDLTLIESEIMKNEGNGILAVEDCTIKIDNSRFYDNGMPHLAAKENVVLDVADSRFIGSKAIYALNHCQLTLHNVHISNGIGIQMELINGTKANLERCMIEKGSANAIKAENNVTIHLAHCHISQHALPQLVINDSSLVCKDSEITDGANNGFIIENHSDAYIQNCFIAKHQYPQVWIDSQCSVDIVSTQIKDGTETDVYVQNNSAVYIEQCVIQNHVSQFNIQAVDFSRVDIARSKIDNFVGEVFYSENNSIIVQKLDEVDY